MKNKKTFALFLFFIASLAASGLLYEVLVKPDQNTDAASVYRNTSIQGAAGLGFSPFSTIIILSPISVFAFVNLALLNRQSKSYRKR